MNLQDFCAQKWNKRWKKNRFPMMIVVLAGICDAVSVNTQQPIEKPLFICLPSVFWTRADLSVEHISTLPPENHEIKIRKFEIRIYTKSYISFSCFLEVALMPLRPAWIHSAGRRKTNQYLPFYWDAVNLSAAHKPALLVQRGKWWLPWLPKSLFQKEAGKCAWSGISGKKPCSQTAASSMMMS